MGAWGFFDTLDFADGSEHTLEYDAPDGIEVTPFSALSEEQEELMRDRIGALVTPDQDRIIAEHYTRMNGGLLIHVKASVFKPLFIRHVLAKSSYWHTLIIVEPGAQAKIIEQFEGSAPIASHVTEVFVQENAHMFYANTQELKGNFLARRMGAVDTDASLDWFELNANKGTTYSRVQSNLHGTAASTKNLSIYLADEKSRLDFGAKAEHGAMHGESQLLTKGVLSGAAKGIYEGTLHIGEDAAKSCAYQEQHALLLTEHADVKASPMLFIDNNDVKCSHAATASKPDQEKMFYLNARGLDKHAAKRLLIKAFVWPVVEAVPAYACNSIIPLCKKIIERFEVGQ